MPTRTTSRSSSNAGRFARQQAHAPGRFGRSSPAPSRFPARRRQAPKPSKADQLMKTVAGALPGRSRAKSKSRGGGRKRAGGMALLAGGMGLALKNREKLTGLLGRRSSKDTEASMASTPPPPVV